MEKKDNNNTTKKVSHDIFSILNDYTKIGTKKESIYKSELLKGSEKERKALRKKLRNVRDNIIDKFNSSDAATKKDIANKWLQYAKGVYTDINIICESNTTTDKLVVCTQFITDIKKLATENK